MRFGVQDISLSHPEWWNPVGVGKMEAVWQFNELASIYPTAHGLDCDALGLTPCHYLLMSTLPECSF
jgi:hypothetical protein